MVDIQQGLAQKSSGNDLRSYRNVINISYPFNWKVVEGNSKYNIVTFLAPSPKSSEIHPAAIAIYKQELPFSSQQANEESLFDAYSFAQIDYIKTHFNITSINKTQLSGSDAYQVVFNNYGKTVSYTWTITNYITKYDVYGIMFVTNSYSYANYLPQLNRMKDSFKIPPPFDYNTFLKYFNSK
jgi:hypothetical protein